MSKKGTINLDKFLSTVQITLDDVLNGATQAMEHASQEAGVYARDVLRNTAPVRQGGSGGAYRRSWEYETQFNHRGKNYGKTTMVVYSEKHYRLTHLLEKGHVIRNKYGTYGRASAIKHIAPAAEEAEEKWLSVFEKEMGRA